MIEIDQKLKGTLKLVNLVKYQNYIQNNDTIDQGIVQ